MNFIGVDLAWKETNPSGLAVLNEMGELVDSRNLMSDQELINYIRKYGIDGAVVAVDASLAIPNEEGSRECERQLTRDFGRYNAGTYPSNRQWHLRTFGRLRGEELVQALGPDFTLGITPPQELIRETGVVKQLIEVYPHAAMVQLFQLEQIIQYKKGKVATRRAEMRRYLDHLQQLAQIEPVIRWGKTEIFEQDLEVLRGRKLKEFEDRLDGIFCAYTAYYWYYWGVERCRVYGDGETGFIVVPGFGS